MTAQEARELTKKVISDKANKEVEEVYKVINTAISKGEYRCHYYKSLSSATLEELEKDGYEVGKIYDPRDASTTYSIKWGELIPKMVIEGSALKAVLDNQEFKTDRTS